MDGDPRTRKRDRMRSFVHRRIVGAGAAVAAGRRLRPRPRPCQTPAGLAAFEGAPTCELVERERADGS